MTLDPPTDPPETGLVDLEQDWLFVGDFTGVGPSGVGGQRYMRRTDER
jgi:hypothetical protein